MKQRIDGCVSSQKSPGVVCLRLMKPEMGMYAHMFLEDFCANFSIDLAPHPLDRDRDFYKVEPPDDSLKDFLLFENYLFLEYDMDKLLIKVMKDLIYSGKAYLEIVTWRDTEGIVKGISFVQIKPIAVLKGRSKTLFASILYNKKLKLYCIENRNLIVLQLKDLGYSRYFLKRLLNRIRKYDLTDVSDMSLNPGKTGFDFNEYIRKKEFSLLKITRNVHWYGRNNENQYMSESYLLYRAAKFKMLRKEFLNYMIRQINKGLQNYKNELGFSGKIVIGCEDIDYMKEFKRLWAGEINTSQLSKLVFRI